VSVMSDERVMRGGAVRNGQAGVLAIGAVHDGPCGVQLRADGGFDAAFRWSRRGARPESAVGVEGSLDGRAVRVMAIAASPITEGFYVARLAPVGG